MLEVPLYHSNSIVLLYACSPCKFFKLCFMLVVPVTTVMPSKPVTIDLSDDYELPPQDFVLSPVLPEESNQHADIERCRGKVSLILF